MTPPSDPSDPRDPSSIFAASVRGTSVGLLVTITLIAFESMSVSAALPTAARELHGLGSYGWAFTGFLVANVVGMIASGQLSDRRGAARPLALGLATFAVGLVVAGTAATMGVLIVGRVVQGLGGGLMITAAYVVIGQAYPDRLRPSIFAAISSAWVVPSLVGPVVSGALAQHASWRWVFLGLVPFLAVGGGLIVPVLRTLPRVTRTRPALDPAQLGRAVAVAAGVAAVAAAGQHPSLGTAALAVVGLALALWGLRPLLPPGTFTARPGVAAPVALRGLFAGAFFGVEAIVPLSLSEQHGYGATAAGLPLTAAGVSWALGSWWQSRPVDERGHHRRVVLIRTGFLGVVVATAGIAVAAVPAVPGVVAYPVWFVGGFGAGLVMSSVGVVLLRTTTDEARGRDSSALQLGDATAAALTTGVVGVLVAAALRGSIGYTAAFVAVGLLMSVPALVGAAAAGRARPAGTAVDGGAAGRGLSATAAGTAAN